MKLGENKLRVEKWRKIEWWGKLSFKDNIQQSLVRHLKYQIFPTLLGVPESLVERSDEAVSGGYEIDFITGRMMLF